ncbi:MAG: flagellar hook-length control protein FliK [Rhizobiaceae bacterium]
MSVAVLTADTSVKAVASRADNRPAKADSDGDSDFKNLVKGEAGCDTAAAHDAKKRGANQGETAKSADDGDDRTIWQRYGTLFERSADSVQEGKNADENTDETESADEIESGEKPDGAVGIVNAAATVSVDAKASEKDATADKSTIAHEKVAPENMGADGKAVSEAARNAEAPSDAKAMTSGALPGEAAAVMGPKTETQRPAQGQASRVASGDHAAGTAQSSAPDVLLSKGNAGGSAADGDGAKRDGQGQGHPSRPDQLQGGNRISGVSVVSQQVTPAAPAAMTPTGAAFVDSLAAGVAKAERAEMTNQPTLAQAATKPGPITTLRIQLQPAELGTVTARLSGTGAQLSIEITVDNAEARHRLTSDSDAIVTALRGLGIDIDRVTVQQSQSNQGATPNNGGRGSEFAQSGDNRGDQQNQASRQGSGRGRGEDAGSGQGNANTDLSGGGVYI